MRSIKKRLPVKEGVPDPGRVYGLLRSKDAVACIAETGHNVGVLIEALVKGCHIKIHIRMEL